MRKPDEHYIMYGIFSREIIFLIFLRSRSNYFKMYYQKQDFKKLEYSGKLVKKIFMIWIFITTV